MTRRSRGIAEKGLTICDTPGGPQQLTEEMRRAGASMRLAAEAHLIIERQLEWLTGPLPALADSANALPAIAEFPQCPTRTTSDGTLTDKDAAVLLRVTPRWLRAHTRGLPFRHDLSRKLVRYDVDGLRRWFALR